MTDGFVRGRGRVVPVVLGLVLVVALGLGLLVGAAWWVPGSWAERSAAPSAAPSAVPSDVPSALPSAVPSAEPSVKAATARPAPVGPAPSAAPGDTAGAWVVSEVVDGDTVDATRGGVTERVRLLGIDTPERGQCGFEEAARALAFLALDRPVDLVTAGRDERDRYDRLLAYVDVLADDGAAPLDAGLSLVTDGYGTARYDSRDGYGAHEREAAYVAADAIGGSVVGCPDTPRTTPTPATPTVPATPAPDAGAAPPATGPGGCDPAYPGTCIPPGPPDLDCGDVTARSFVVLPPDPHRFDADGNGFGCESG